MTNKTPTFPSIIDGELDTIIKNSWKEITKTESPYNKPSDFVYFSIGFKAAVIEFRKRGIIKYE